MYKKTIFKKYTPQITSKQKNLPVYFVENCSAAEAAVDAADEGGGGGVGRGTLK